MYRVAGAGGKSKIYQYQVIENNGIAFLRKTRDSILRLTSLKFPPVTFLSIGKALASQLVDQTLIAH